MTLDEVIEYFGSSYQFHKKTGMSHTCYVHWKKNGYIPILSQNRIEKMTNGALISRFSDGEGDEMVNVNKKELIVVDSNFLREASGWDYGDSPMRPEIVSCVYHYMKTKYQQGDSIDDMVVNIGVAEDRISRSLKLLEDNGYLTSTRISPPYNYRIVK